MLFHLASDARRTDVTGYIDNDSDFPVNVIVRVRGFDHGDNLVSDIEVGPYRDLLPGTSQRIGAVLGLTPVKSVTMDVVEVSRHQP